MRNLCHLTRREFTGFFYTPVAYIVMGLFLLASGYIFSWALGVTREANMRYALGFINFFLLFLTPLITMRLLAEEKRSGTIEVLRTAPVTDLEVVLSKFLGALGFYLVLLAPTLSYVGIFVIFDASPDWGVIISSYLGLALLGCAFLSIGLWASSLTKNQIVAALITFVILLLLTIGGSEISESVLDRTFDRLSSSGVLAPYKIFTFASAQSGPTLPCRGQFAAPG